MADKPQEQPTPEAQVDADLGDMMVKALQWIDANPDEAARLEEEAREGADALLKPKATKPLATFKVPELGEGGGLVGEAEDEDVPNRE